MNDFTKDMLLDLRKCVRIAAMEYGDCERLDFLERKLQSMIDNYCESEMIHRKAASTPISDDEPILCRFERMVDGKWETYLSVGPFNCEEMKTCLKGLIVERINIQSNQVQPDVNGCQHECDYAGAQRSTEAS